MSDLLTVAELQAELHAAVKAAGGAKKWCRKNKVFGYDHSMHLIANGDGATLRDVMAALGYREVRRFEKIKQED